MNRQEQIKLEGKKELLNLLVNTDYQLVSELVEKLSTEIFENEKRLKAESYLGKLWLKANDDNELIILIPKSFTNDAGSSYGHYRGTNIKINFFDVSFSNDTSFYIWYDEVQEITRELLDCYTKPINEIQQIIDMLNEL